MIINDAVIDHHLRGQSILGPFMKHVFRNAEMQEAGALNPEFLTVTRQNRIPRFAREIFLPKGKDITSICRRVRKMDTPRIACSLDPGEDYRVLSRPSKPIVKQLRQWSQRMPAPVFEYDN